jgi:hypothetical protein
MAPGLGNLRIPVIEDGGCIGQLVLFLKDLHLFELRHCHCVSYCVVSPLQNTGYGVLLPRLVGLSFLL